MPRTTEDSFWKRLKLLLRGLFFYNTVYWRRASDGLKPPRLSAVEREVFAPARNLEVIKPRENPRARLKVAERRRMMDELARLKVKLPPGKLEPAVPLKPAPLPASAAAPLRRAMAPPMPTLKRRRRRREAATAEDARPAGKGLVARLLGKFGG